MADNRIPEYHLEDLEEKIIITIAAPLSKPREAAFVLENNIFIFDSNPYFLNIKLPHNVSDLAETQTFDDETATYHIILKKVGDELQESCEEESVAISILDEFPYCDKNTDLSSIESNGKQYYGFCNSYSNMFGKSMDEFSDIISLPNPDFTSVGDRRKLRLEEEMKKWNEDHYLADTMETDHLQSIFEFKPLWISSPIKELNEDEKKIIGLKNSFEFSNLSEENRKLCELQIIDLLFSYSYNKRTTEGDNSVESGWTINKLSGTLSWFEVYEDLKTVILTCYKRSLIFPLYRNWDLTKLVHNDVVKILQIGSKQVAHCLLEVKEVFNESENRYILNTLYVNKLCCYSYYMTDERCRELSEKVNGIKIRKYDVNSELPLLEMAAHLTLEEEKQGGRPKEISDIIDEISKLKLENENNSSSGEFTESSDSDVEDSDSSECSDNDD